MRERRRDSSHPDASSDLAAPAAGKATLTERHAGPADRGGLPSGFAQRAADGQASLDDDMVFREGGIGRDVLKPGPKPGPVTELYDVAEIEWGEMAMSRKREVARPAPVDLYYHRNPARGIDAQPDDPETVKILKLARKSLPVFAKDVGAAEKYWNAAVPTITAYYDVSAKAADLEKMYGLGAQAGTRESADAALENTSVQTSSGADVDVESVFGEDDRVALSKTESAGVDRAHGTGAVTKADGDANTADYAIIEQLEEVARCVDLKLAASLATQAACLDQQIDAAIDAKGDKEAIAAEWKAKRDTLVSAVSTMVDLVGLAVTVAGGPAALIGKVGKGPVQLSMFEKSVHPARDYVAKLGTALREKYQSDGIEMLISKFGDLAYGKQIEAAQLAVDEAGAEIKKFTKHKLQLEIDRSNVVGSAAGHELAKAQAGLARVSSDRLGKYRALGAAAAAGSGLTGPAKDRIEAAITMIPMVELVVARAREAYAVARHPYYSAASGIGANIAEQDGVDLAPFIDTVGGLIGWRSHLEIALRTWAARLDSLHDLRARLRPTSRKPAKGKDDAGKGT